MSSEAFKDIGYADGPLDDADRARLQGIADLAKGIRAPEAGSMTDAEALNRFMELVQAGNDSAADQLREEWAHARLARARQENPNAQLWQVEKDITREIIEASRDQKIRRVENAPDYNVIPFQPPRVDEGAAFDRYMADSQPDGAADQETAGV